MVYGGAAAKSGMDYGPLIDSPGFLLRLAQLDAYARYFEAAQPDSRPKNTPENTPENTPGTMAILLMIRHNPGIRQGVVARALRIKRAHMTKIMHRLSQAGLVETAVPEDDRRALTLRLTQAGEACATALWHGVAASETAALPRLSADETATLRRLLQKHLGLAAPVP